MCNSMCNNNCSGSGMDFCWIILVIIVIWAICGNGSIFGGCGCGCDCGCN